MRYSTNKELREVEDAVGKPNAWCQHNSILLNARRDYYPLLKIGLWRLPR